MQATPSIATELRGTIRLALPVVLGELGWMAMGVCDSLMVGGLGPAALGAVSVGRTLTMGTLVDGTWLAALLAVPLTLIVAWLAGRLDLFGMAPEVQELARPYLRARLWGIAPLLLATAFRRSLQGIGMVRPIMIALVSANLVNAAGNWLLIHGKLGLPSGRPLGRRGPGGPRRGAGRPGARRAGWMAIGLGAGSTLVASAPLVFSPAAIVRLFDGDPGVEAPGVTLLHVAAAFLFFDALQGVATGALRGIGDTRSPVVANLVSRWVLGLPIGYTLCFPLGRGAIGLWLGWLVGLGAVAIVVVGMWVRGYPLAAVGKAPGRP